jgi:SPP1 gp7 family putative phage head morphogenesis protein
MSELLQQQLSDTPPKKGIKPAVRVGIEYNSALQLITREIKKDIDTVLIPALRKLSPQYSKDSVITVTTRDAWLPEITGILQQIITKWSSPSFRALGESIARKFVKSADDVNEKRFGINIYGDDVILQEYIEASIYDNTNLITSIPTQYLAQVESIVMTNVRAGNRSSSIIKTLQQQYGVSKRRAKQIARDQTAKVNGDLSKKRQQLAGFDYFKWQDSDDSRVRDRHESIANKMTEYGKGVYRWDNPPLSDKGVPIIPGSDYSCRCIAIPVSNEEVKENQNAGRTRKGVKR